MIVAVLDVSLNKRP